ncbi:amidase signature enzyme [Tothia fuscella]|uniref:Amidase signature enzyme n=1 Tax=Tothia fuscella TaxID=1048955 RepID=A0A9P4NE69_9PEZI|nr:amidase signature enzyme [Tothia fuscella]
MLLAGFTVLFNSLVHGRIFLQSPLQLKNLGRNVEVNDISYFIPGWPEVSFENYGELTSASSDSFMLPVTHVVASISAGQTFDLTSTLDRFGTADDVWSPAFGKTVFLSGTTSHSSICDSTVICMDGKPAMSNVTTLPPGPYFADVTPATVSFYRAYRAYLDDANAFYYGVLPMPKGDFQVFSPSSRWTDGRASIAVPSRLYYPSPSETKPLSGVRVAVKDIYNLKGLKTSMGNRAWFRFYPSADKTAPCIQYLIDLGAIIIGKTRTSQFANGEAPTADWVDNQDPFNARGDGYQDPSSSSAGAGSAQSNYDWVDMNIGSDTGGSMRAPGAVSGLYANRASQDIMNLEGVLTMSPEMDTPGFVARTAHEFATWGKAWYGRGNSTLKPYTSFPSRLMYPIDTLGINTTLVPSPGFFPVASVDAQALYDEFTAGLERFLGTTRTVFDFYTEYKITSGVNEYPLDHLGSVWSLMTTYEQYHSVLKPFFANYSAANGGDKPYVDPPVQENINYGANLTATDFANALTNKTIFQKWTEANLLTPMPDTDHCSSALFIHPIYPGTPNYRDNYPASSPKKAGIWFGWNQYGVSQLAGVPEVVVPVGQVNYTSRITGTTKFLPVAVSINAAAGCDLLLYNLVEQLAANGVIPKAVKTGGLTF